MARIKVLGGTGFAGEAVVREAAPERPLGDVLQPAAARGASGRRGVRQWLTSGPRALGDDGRECRCCLRDHFPAW